MIAVLADDLTSALDGAAPFVGRGLSARVVFDEDVLAHGGTDVVSLDLDSRFLEPSAAEARFHAWSAAFARTQVVYKTVDSTLRGNLAAEARGALAGSGRRSMVVAPAFPAAGRTTEGGHQFVHGVPVERTDFGRDPRTPVTNGRVADHFAELAPEIFSVQDATNDSDLDEVVRRFGLEASVLWVGSPGLAAALARAVPLISRSARTTSWSRPERVLVVMGSLHPGNAAQVERLRSLGAATVEVCAPLASAPRLADDVTAAFETANVVCLLAPQVKLEGGPVASAELAQLLSAAVERCAAQFDGLIATGGDTARRTVDALGARCLDLAGEVEAGVPLGLLRTRAGDLPFATKAGGFGHPGTLAHCIDRLRSGGARTQ